MEEGKVGEERNWLVAGQVGMKVVIWNVSIHSYAMNLLKN